MNAVKLHSIKEDNLRGLRILSTAVFILFLLVTTGKSWLLKYVPLRFALHAANTIAGHTINSSWRRLQTRLEDLPAQTPVTYYMKNA
jgi:hypothetical protein